MMEKSCMTPRFTLLAHEHELHTTPGGMSQAFNHALLRFA